MNNQWTIHHHLAAEMDSRLLLLRREPKHIILHGADGDSSRSLLAKRYPQAIFDEFDFRENDLFEAAHLPTRQRNWLTKLTKKNSVKQHFFSKETKLPEHLGDMLWANLMLPHWGANTADLLANWHGALLPDGMLFFSCLGSLSIPEWRKILDEADEKYAALGLPDMHDLGDLLVDSHFYDPIVDTIELVLAYENWQTLCDDAEKLGLWAALLPENEIAAKTVIEAAWQRGELRKLTLELIYGHALKREILPDKMQTVQFYPKGSFSN